MDHFSVNPLSIVCCFLRQLEVIGFIIMANVIFGIFQFFWSYFVLGRQLVGQEVNYKILSHIT